MGRPVDNRIIGNTSATGNQIECTVNFGVGNNTGYIVKQFSLNKFYVSDFNETKLCKLVDSNFLNTNEFCVTVQPLSGPVEYAKRIESNLVVTHSGNVYKWVMGAPSTTQEATIQHS